MGPHELVLLSPYRYPGQNSLILGNEDMASWLNGYTALWHPALIWNAKGPPRCDAQYDHEQPQSGYVYALPESPPLYLPDDWEERVRAAGSIAFKAGVDRAATLENLKTALAAAGERAPGWPQGIDQPAACASPFFGLGLGYLLQATLAEAMEHENLLDAGGFWDDVQQAVAQLAGFSYSPSSATPATNPETASYPGYERYGPEGQEWDQEPPPHLEPTTEEQAPNGEGGPGESSAAGMDQGGRETVNEGDSGGTTETSAPTEWRDHLRNAAQRLVSAREVLYPVTIHLLDLCVLDEKKLDQPWPASLAMGTPLNVLACGRLLEDLASLHPEKFQELKARVQTEDAEVCGGVYLEREDPYMPLDSQLWNLQKGLAVSRKLLEADVRVFARRRFGYSPQTPLLLTTSGLTRALFLCFDESSGLAQYSSCVVAWPSPDGKQVDAFVRAPYAADNPQTFFNLGHYWFKTTREDHAATLAFVHSGQPAAPWYHDIMELARLAPVLGTWNTFSRYFNEVSAGEYPAALSADEFHSDYLSERVNNQMTNPVSSFAVHLRQRRRLDACWTLAALQRGLAGTRDTLQVENALELLEDQLEGRPGTPLPELEEMEKSIAGALAERLQSRAAPDQPGYLLLNPCAFARRVALELEGAQRPLAVGGIIKASQLDGSLVRAVVEVPALGFAWIPREGPPGTTAMASRIKVADQATHTIRNEFFEVEVDPVTGGLKAIRDHKTHINRLGQRLVFNPGSRMVAREIRVTSAGPALAEIVSSGELVGEQNQVLATFKQRLRAWLGRPLLEMRIELQPVQPPAGYPWHAYYGCRFAWRDERTMILRGVNASTYITTHPRPQSGDFIELRFSRLSTAIFPCGLPFHQRLEGRMLDIILQPEGEQATVFDLGIALDRDMPMQTALGLSSPIAVVPTSKGPPHVGASGWLFHLDTPNLLMTRMVPGKLEKEEPAAAAKENALPGEATVEPGASAGAADRPLPGFPDAITARLYECAGHSGHAEFRCVRNPQRAVILDARGNYLVQASPSGDAVLLEVSPNDLVHLQVEFS